ncbi:MAG: tripartite tricarboxylate transporter permease [Candidatus Anstonellales archaeon]
MVLEFFITFLVGIIFSLIPSFHPSNIAPLFQYAHNKEFLIAILYSSNLIFSIVISSIFLIPDSSTNLIPLPAQRLVKRDKANIAIMLIISSIIIASILTILLIPVLSNMYYFINKNVLSISLFFIVLIFSSYSILAESNKLIAFFYFLITGLFGILAINLLQNPFLTIFSSLYGVSSIITSQEIVFKKIRKKFNFFSKISKIMLTNFPIFFIAILLSFLAEFLPTISSDSQLAFLFFPFLKNDYQAIMLLAAISSSHLITTLISNFSISLKRTAFSIQIGNIDSFLLLISMSLTIFITFLISSIIISFALTKIKKLKISHNFKKFFLVVLILLNFFYNSITGLFFMLFFYILGLIPYFFGIKRFIGMGSITLNYLISSAQKLFL